MFRALVGLIGFGAIAASACQNDADVPPRPAAPDAKWVSLSGGCFNMGETRIYPEEGPVMQMCLKPFEMWSHEITNAEFANFVESTGYKTRAELGWKASDASGPGTDIPPSSAVFTLPDGSDTPSWWRLVDGANWRRPFGPKTSISDVNAPVIHLTREDAMAYAKWAGGRLPSEAEWEYAARGGLDGQLTSWAEAEEAALIDRANTWQGIFPAINSKEDGYAGTAPVGSYPANGFGLYDMIGNVWEWTSSNYYSSHNVGEAARIYPQGYDPTQGDVPVGVIKGGSFLCARSYCYRYRPAARQGQDLIFGTSHIGFRIARDIPA